MPSPKSRVSDYLRENPGADFIAAFIIALVLAALIYPFGPDIANEIVNFAFFSLVAGVILQILSLRRSNKPPDRNGETRV
jgi:hypothetical protein